MKNKKKPENAKKPEYRRHERAYGGDVPICANTGCVLRKKAKCSGFEGCPGFKGK